MPGRAHRIASSRGDLKSHLRNYRARVCARAISISVCVPRGGGIIPTPLRHLYIDDTILKKNTDHNTTLLTHYASVDIDVALTIYADGKSI